MFFLPFSAKHALYQLRDVTQYILALGGLAVSNPGYVVFIIYDTMLMGFSLDLSALPKLSCSTDRTYKCLGSQLWVFLSSEESTKAITVSQP